jgi:superfamily II DNA/RNA helicase
MELLLKARMVCNSTYHVDRKTHISPKLKELAGILDELVISGGRKVVIFSEWTTMTFLIGRHLSEAGIKFVELSGKVPVKKRQALIDEFTSNPDCKVFLSTDAGGTGLNLQAADCVINFELPWSPARMNQRIGRVNRIGQKSRCVNVINLIAKDSIEEKIFAGIQLKTDLFKGVFDGGQDVVEFSREKRTEMLNRLREMIGEEPAPVIGEPAAVEEIPEDAPGYLNPEVLEREETARKEDVFGEEGLSDASLSSSESAPASSSGQGDDAGQSPEKMEEILNSGMAFIGGLMEMATGQKMATVAGEEKMVRVDRETGEVTLKFKLPGF